MADPRIEVVARVLCEQLCILDEEPGDMVPARDGEGHHPYWMEWTDDAIAILAALDAHAAAQAEREFGGR